ncbi:hypothetical protein OF897_04390 [Chryseobacterium formosus]|uniref:Uncharacterized protein n=1 Tax=Chryseobacterium formosus TaxID=1537363 RepID=A0ABT3XM18_9FLAO|nr:hypothetical protein [Chryseobacterium formosus]MCX8523160.1 hypothetical protein [Chryseobacterium formosus]
MYRESVSRRTKLVHHIKSSRYGFLQNLLELTEFTKYLASKATFPEFQSLINKEE